MDLLHSHDPKVTKQAKSGVILKLSSLSLGYLFVIIAIAIIHKLKELRKSNHFNH